MNPLSWCSCDGHGGEGQASTPRRSGTESALGVTRRGILAGAASGSVWWLAGQPALGRVLLSPKGGPGHVLVVVFLRGGADGLNIVVPYGEDAYYRSRPSLGIPKGQLLDLGGGFGMHPNMPALHRLYKEEKLGLVHAVGSQDRTRSHFEAMSAMERGVATNSAGEGGGWLARYLGASQAEGDSPLRAVAIGGLMPDSLRGATNALAIAELSEFRIVADKEESFRRALRELYGSGRDAMSQAGRETLTVLEALNRLDPGAYRPSGGATYPESELGSGLRQVAMLIKAEVGLEVACVDRGGWDTHVAQGSTEGWLAGNVLDVSESLDAFVKDLGSAMNGVTVVVQTEFGRRLRENSALGTDHGRASVFMALGAGIAGGKIHGRWPGLEAADLDDIGDLEVANDYRDLLAEILGLVRMADPSVVFPGHKVKTQGITA